MPLDPLTMPRIQYGPVYAFSELFFFESGTDVPLATYSDPDGDPSHVNTNPLVADANGLFGPIYVLPDAYKVVFATSAGVIIWTQDAVTWPAYIIGGDIITSHIFGTLIDGVQRIEVTVDNGRGFIVGDNAALSWLSSSPPDAEYIANGAKVIASNEAGEIGLSGISRTSDSAEESGHVAIGIAGFSFNDDETFQKPSWGGYFESSRKEDAGIAMGLEVDVVNFGTTFQDEDPYNLNGQGTRAVAAASGGEHGTTEDTSAAFTVTPNGSKFGRGIIFANGSLRSRSASLGNYGNMIAVSMAAKHTLEWVTSDGTQFSFIDAQYDPTLNQESIAMSFGVDTILFLNPTSEKLLMKITKPTNSVNYLDFFANVTGSPVIIEAEGDDTDINIKFIPKGAGVMQFGALTAQGGSPATTGYITIKDEAGNTRKLAVIS